MVKMQKSKKNVPLNFVRDKDKEYNISHVEVGVYKFRRLSMQGIFDTSRRSLPSD